MDTNHNQESFALFRIRAEADPEYKFTKPLPKKAEKVVKRDLTVQCTVNDYKAPVRWFKGDVEIKVLTG